MSSKGSEHQAQASNPFSTRFVRPGALKYVFAEGQSARGMVDRLSELGWCAQIVGPHGCGKSTLLAALVEPLERADRRPIVFSLHDGQRRMPGDWFAQVRRSAARLVVIDGSEQLSRLSRFWVSRRCRRQGWGLLVTAHSDVGLATLFRIEPSLEVVRKLVRQLLSDSGVLVADETIERSFVASRENVRETLFALYDHYEKRLSQP